MQVNEILMKQMMDELWEIVTHALADGNDEMLEFAVRCYWKLHTTQSDNNKRSEIMNKLWDDALTAHVRDGNNGLMMALFKQLRDMGADNEQIEKQSDWYAAEFIKRAMA
jgi:hypothetical protein